MTALKNYQLALDIGSKAVVAEDFEAYAGTIDLPYLVHTATARLLVTSVDELQPTFKALCAGLKARGITHYERLARSADYVDRDRIDGTHNTHILANGEPMAYPYVSRATLVRRGRLWLFSEAHYDNLQASRWPLTTSDIFDHAKAIAPEVKE